MRRLLTVLAGAFVLAAAGCGGSEEPATPTPSASVAATPAAFDHACLQGTGAKRITIADGVDAAVIGTGPTAVILYHGGLQPFCDWFPLAGDLVGAGYTVLISDHSGSPAREHFDGAVAELGRLGATRVFPLGSSRGATEAINAAAEIGPPIAGVVSLSSPRQSITGLDAVKAARRLTVPLFAVAAKEDQRGGGPDLAAITKAAKKSSRLVVPGWAHGNDLVTGEDRTVVIPAILKFIAAQKGS